MAMSLIYLCKACGFTAEGWDDGNPYIEFANGKRKYFYHPGGEDQLYREILLEDFQISLDDSKPFIELGNAKEKHYYLPGEVKALFQDILQFHPDKESWEEKKSGNAPDHICLDCKEITKLDPRRDEKICPQCKGTNLAETYHLKGKPCPDCGEILGEGMMGAIS